MATFDQDAAMRALLGDEANAFLDQWRSGYEGVDMSVPNLSKQERQALRQRGINPKHFRPYLAGPFKGFEFSGDFGQDLQALNQLYTDAGGQMMSGDAKSPQGMQGFNYKSALDALFQQYPDQQTFGQSPDNRNLYMNVGIPYFRQGDRTGWMPGGELGDFSAFHINDDTDALGKFIGGIADSPITNLLDIAFPAPIPGIPIPGGGGGNFLVGDNGPGQTIPGTGMGWGDIIGGIGGLIGDGSTYDGPPKAPTGGFESIYDDVPGVPDLDVPGPGGSWDLIDIETPGGGSLPDEPTTPAVPPTGSIEPPAGGGIWDQSPEDLQAWFEWIEQQQQGAVPPDSPTEGPGATPPPQAPEEDWIEPLPEVDDPIMGEIEPPADQPATDPRGPDYWEMIGGILDGTIQLPGGDQPPAGQPTPPGGGGVEQPTLPGPGTPGTGGGTGGDDGGGDVFFPDPNQNPGTGWWEQIGDWAGDWTGGWLPGDWDGTPPIFGGGQGGTWPGGGYGQGTGVGTGGAGGAGGTGGSVGDINIDFGDLLSTAIGGYLGWDQSKQNPQYPNLKDLYGGDFENAMKGLRWDILGQSPDDWIADLTPQQRAAIQQATNWGRDEGQTIFDRQMRQGGLGLGGLGSMGDYANYLRATGGPQFQYNQGVFDQTMQNLMPGVAGTYQDLTRDLFRNLNEQAIPGLNQQASATGNMASSRAGLTEGVLTRGALDRAGDIQSQLMQNALNQAQGAAMGAGGQNLRAALGTQGDIFGGYGSMAQYGLPGMGDAYRTGLGNINLLQGAGDFMQRYNQSLLNAPRDLLGWQIPLINQTTPAGVGSLPSPYTQTNPLEGIQQGMQTGAGIWDWWKTGPWSTAGNAAGTT